MKRELTYTVLGIALLFSYFAFAVNICAQASEVEYIAFSSMRDGNHEIYLMDTNGKNLRNLTNHRASECHPTWSPDGRWIAFVSRQDGNSELYVMD